MSARPGPGGGCHAEWYPYRDRQLSFCTTLGLSQRLIDRLHQVDKQGRIANTSRL